MTPTFIPFPKMGRLRREAIITEKIDGTNSTVHIVKLADNEIMPTGTPIVACHGDLLLYAGSRTRWITPENDNFGFASWVRDNASQLIELGVGTHRGEWWGRGIQRNYGLKERRFSLFNAMLWAEEGSPLGIASTVWDEKARQMIEKPQKHAPACCNVVPVLYRGMFSTGIAGAKLCDLAEKGSRAARGFMKPEGIVVFHTASQVGFKATIEGDDSPKSAF